jgi:hypothetical protein
MAHIVFIHGLANKPASDYLFDVWKRKLAHEDGVDVDSYDVGSAMAYWADVLYPEPDTDLAAYEAAASLEALKEAPSPEAVGSFDEIAADPKLRRLSIAVGVDPEAPGAEEPPPGDIQNVQMERVPVPAWLRKRIMARFVRDAYLYFNNVEFSPRAGASFHVRDELRKRFLEKLNAAADGAPIVVVSHSMGTIIAYDCLMHETDCPAIDGLMTVGSPLGLDEVQDFFPAWTREDGFPSAKLRGRWVNIYDPLDPVVGLDPIFANDYRRNGQPAVEDIREDNWGTWRHSISKYLQGKRLRTNLTQMLGITWP